MATNTRENMWSAPAGMSESFTVTIQNRSGPITGQYTGAEALPVTVWPGGSQASVSGILSAQWLDATNGKVTAILAPPATTAPGRFRFRMAVTSNGVTTPFHEGWLRVESIPGTTTPPATYCSYQDMIDLGGEAIVRLMQDGAGDSVDFLTERAQAREWLDDIIVSKSRPYAYRWDLSYALTVGTYPWGPVESPDSAIIGYLASNYLMIRPRTIECTAYKALAFAAEKRRAFDEDSAKWLQLATWYHRKASNSLRRYRCEIDVNADGRADIAFNLGTLTFR